MERGRIRATNGGTGFLFPILKVILSRQLKINVYFPTDINFLQSFREKITMSFSINVVE